MPAESRRSSPRTELQEGTGHRPLGAPPRDEDISHGPGGPGKWSLTGAGGETENNTRPALDRVYLGLDWRRPQSADRRPSARRPSQLSNPKSLCHRDTRAISFPYLRLRSVVGTRAGTAPSTTALHSTWPTLHFGLLFAQLLRSQMLAADVAWTIVGRCWLSDSATRRLSRGKCGHNNSAGRSDSTRNARVWSFFRFVVLLS